MRGVHGAGCGRTENLCSTWSGGHHGGPRRWISWELWETEASTFLKKRIWSQYYIDLTDLLVGVAAKRSCQVDAVDSAKCQLKSILVTTSSQLVAVVTATLGGGNVKNVLWSLLPTVLLVCPREVFCCS